MKTTVSSMDGWRKVAKGEYRHEGGAVVKKCRQGWEVVERGVVFQSMWAAMQAAAQTAAKFKGDS